jgi:hypothetical protein
MDTPEPEIDHVTDSFADTEPRAVAPSSISLKILPVVIVGDVVSATLTERLPVVAVFPAVSVAVIVKL